MSSLRITLLNTILFISLLLLACSKPDTLFEQLPVEETGIEFNNEIFENDSVNIVNYTNMYNGGGVGIADFNNDGFQDIYFTGAMVDNELYLNMGQFKFKNVTKEANVAAPNKWSSGVAVVDINHDGLMDIYVCATTNDQAEQRTNLLYINQGLNDQKIPVFKEMAKEYNLADTAHTTMAAFFDYDNDGDLDLFLMVNQFNRKNSMNRTNLRMTQNIDITSDKLFENVASDSLGHPYFREVSKEAGITKEGYGLGVNITDINRDGWKDIYVANDFFTNDVLYINNRDGSFTDKSAEIFKHTAYAAMGNDVADLNNDGYPEVLVVDMRPGGNYRKKKTIEPNDYSEFLSNKRKNYDDQFVRNVLEVYQGINPETGEPLYSETGIYSGIAETDWSWAPLLVDFDNDGWRDIVITNGFPREMTDNDFEKYFQLYPQYLSLPDLLEQLPSVKISNYIYQNKKDLIFKDVTSDWGMKTPSFSNGAAQVDLNNDGALDFVVNNINEPAFIYRNRLAEAEPGKNNFLRISLSGIGKNTMGLGASLKIEYDDEKIQFHEHTTYRGYESSVEPIIHFGLGNTKIVDKLTVNWPDGRVQVIEDITSNRVLNVRQEDASDIGENESTMSQSEKILFSEVTKELNIDYSHKEWDYNDYNVQPLLPHKLSQYGPGLSVGDVNSDGLDDLYIGGAFEYEGTFLVQQSNGKFVTKDLLFGNDINYREEEMSSLFFDADGDGDEDLYIVSGSYEHTLGDKAYQDRLFINEDGKFLLAENALPSFLSSGSTIRAADFDRDGDLDLFVGGRVKPHRYPEPVDSYILENISENGTVKFKIVNDQIAPQLNSFGMVADGLWSDFNDDGWVDLILLGEWTSVTILENNAGTFSDITKQSGLSAYKGWWNSICGGDFDRDGDTDYVAGNLGSNTFFQASNEYPVKIYAKDFDNNGNFDAIPSIYDEDSDGNKIEVPYHGLRNLSQQLPALKEEFETFDDFAKITMGDLLSKFETSGMLTLEANYMKSSYIENLGNGSFDLRPLPYKTQWAPIYGCSVNDITDDGNQDVLLVGNEFGMELSTNRADALNGLLLEGNGEGGFNVLDFDQSGFFVPGDGKALVSYINNKTELVVAASQNRGQLKVFRKENMKRHIPVKSNDAFAIVFLKNDLRLKKEFYYGSGFMSQSERYLSLPDDYLKVEITDYLGNTRIISRAGEE